jgi:uncharacterized protein YegP (UPF0339 family)
MTAETRKPLFRIGPFEGWPAQDGSVYYTEVGANGETLNTSETYSTKEHAEEGARAALERAREAGSGETPEEALSGPTPPTPEDAEGEVPENEG